MYNRYCIFFLCIFLFLTSCRSTRVHDNGSSTTEIRDGISELERRELEAQKIQSELEKTSDEIGSSLDRQTEHYNVIDGILQQIRNQVIRWKPGED